MWIYHDNLLTGIPSELEFWWKIVRNHEVFVLTMELNNN